MTFSATTVQSLKDILAAAVDVQDGGVPGITAVVFDKTGRELLVHSAGTLGASSAAPMTPAHVFWMASCTKVVTVVGVMQLVEAARLRDVQVLRDDGALEPKRRGITLRMLLTHTSGCGYSIFSEKLRDHGYPAGFDEFSGRVQDLKTPLIAHPGESWQYGTSIDWAGIALERLTGVTLNEYIQTNICKPLGLDSVNMIPTAEMKANLAHMSFRDPTGKIRPGNHFYRQPLVVSTPEEEANLFHSGGAGLFAKPQEYCRILAVLLNDGTCPTTNVTLLSARTVADIFSNQIPQFPDFAQQSLPAARPELTNPLPYLYPTVPSAPQGWGLACMLNGGVTGRSESTGWWAGLANLFWWVDRERGVGGLVCAQVLPFADAKVMGAWFALETAVYAALEESK